MISQGDRHREDDANGLGQQTAAGSGYGRQLRSPLAGGAVAGMEGRGQQQTQPHEQLGSTADVTHGLAVDRVHGEQQRRHGGYTPRQTDGQQP